jgi:hypothetical protein
MMQRAILSMSVLLMAAAPQTEAFCPSPQFGNYQHPTRYDTSLGIFDKLGEMFQELDNFIDDASARCVCFVLFWYREVWH